VFLGESSKYGEGGKYDPDVEHILQINNVGRKFVSHSGKGDGNGDGDGENVSSGTVSIINNALWPIVVERAYKKSGRIFAERDKIRCATGLFYLVQHYWPMLMGNHRRLAECYDDGNDDDRSNNNKTV
jgi:hypothetical protein